MQYTVRDMTFDVQGLTRGELKEFKAENVQLDTLSEIKDLDAREKATDRVLKAAAPDCDPDKLTPAEIMETILTVSRLTYLGEGELKNFAESRASGTRGGSKPAANVKTKGSRRKGAARS